MLTQPVHVCAYAGPFQAHEYPCQLALFLGRQVQRPVFLIVVQQVDLMEVTAQHIIKIIETPHCVVRRAKIGLQEISYSHALVPIIARLEILYEYPAIMGFQIIHVPFRERGPVIDQVFDDDRLPRNQEIAQEILEGKIPSIHASDFPGLPYRQAISPRGQIRFALFMKRGNLRIDGAFHRQGVHVASTIGGIYEVMGDGDGILEHDGLVPPPRWQDKHFSRFEHEIEASGLGEGGAGLNAPVPVRLIDVAIPEIGGHFRGASQPALASGNLSGP